MFRRLRSVSLRMLALTSLPAAAAMPSLAPATIAQGYEAAHATAQQRAGIALSLPGEIPAGSRLYAYADPTLNRRRHVVISFDGTPACHGAHVCSVGRFTATDTPIAVMRDRGGKTISRVLPNGAMFTPDHAMADMFPAQIQWRIGGLTYTVTWAGLPPARAEAILSAVMHSAGTLPG